MDFDLQSIISSFGYLGLTLTFFVQTGLILGVFLPGDSLLVTIGLLASRGVFELPKLLPLLILASFTGDVFSYWFGRRAGPAIFNKKSSFFFSKKYLKKSHDFYQKHGAKTMVLARFIPIVRTFAPIVAGVGKMPFTQLVIFSAIGATLWVSSLTLLGYYLGSVIPNLDNYLVPIILGVIILSLIPKLIEHLREKK